MDEFQIINEYLTKFQQDPALITGIGDDCAVIQPPTGEQLLVTTDSLLEGSHFPAKSPPKALGYRCCAIALSDIAAVGGTARWASLSLTMPSYDRQWIEPFVDGLGAALSLDQTSLIGGDLTHGPLSIGWHVIGSLPTGSALLRSGALPGDSIFVSGFVGGAAYGLNELQQHEPSDIEVKAYWAPQPRLALGRKLRNFASSCIDISDGLLADLQHITTASQCGAEIDLEALPIDKILRHLPSDIAQTYALQGGDDYELCFTAPSDRDAKIFTIGAELGIPMARIGHCVADREIRLIDSDGQSHVAEIRGYRHFI